MLHIDPQNLPIVIINFLIVAFVVGKLLFKPVIQAIQKRQASVDDVVSKVNAEEEKIHSLESENNRLQQEMNERKKQINEEINLFTEQYRSEKMSEVDAEIKKAREQANIELNEKRKYTAKKYQQDFIDISTLLTEKVLNRSLSEEEKSDSINQFLDSLEEVSAERLSSVNEYVTDSVRMQR